MTVPPGPSHVFLVCFLFSRNGGGGPQSLASSGTAETKSYCARYALVSYVLAASEHRGERDTKQASCIP